MPRHDDGYVYNGFIDWPPDPGNAGPYAGDEELATIRLVAGSFRDPLEKKHVMIYLYWIVTDAKPIFLIRVHNLKDKKQLLRILKETGPKLMNKLRGRMPPKIRERMEERRKELRRRETEGSW